MKKLSLVLTALLLFTFHGSAQDPAEPDAKPALDSAPADPFVKEKGKKTEPGKPAEGPATMTNVGVVVQYIDVKRERWQQWLSENHASLDATPLRKEVETWIAAGDAILAESSLVMGKSGQRLKVESVRSVIYPSQFLEDGSGQPFPDKTETRNVGTTTEVDPLLDADGSVVLHFAPERVVYAGENPPRVEEGVMESDLRYPLFDLQKVTTSVSLDPGSWGLVGCEQSLERGATHQTLVLARSVLHRFEELPAKTESGPHGMLTFTWLEVSHETLNTSLMKLTDLSPWVGGGFHDEVKKSGAKVLEERSHHFKSGQRSKNESIREVIYPTSWIQPTEGDFATPGGFETRNVGTSVEVDAVLSSGGGTLDINMSPEICSHVGDDVSHRVLIEGEWKPNVTMAAFYTMQPTTMLSLPLNTPVLAAVMSPPNENGWTDPSRNVLLFVKFSR